MSDHAAQPAGGTWIAAGSASFVQALLEDREAAGDVRSRTPRARDRSRRPVSRARADLLERQPGRASASRARACGWARVSGPQRSPARTGRRRRSTSSSVGVRVAAELQLVVEAVDVDARDREQRRRRARARARRAPTTGAQRAGPQHREAAERHRGEHDQRERRRRSGSARSPTGRRSPISTNVPIPAASSASGIAASRGLSATPITSPISDAISTGSLDDVLEELRHGRRQLRQRALAPELLRRGARVGAARTAGRR